MAAIAVAGLSPASGLPRSCLGLVIMPILYKMTKHPTLVETNTYFSVGE